MGVTEGSSDCGLLRTKAGGPEIVCEPLERTNHSLLFSTQGRDGSEFMRVLA